MATKDDYTIQQLESLAKRLREVRKARGFSNYEQFAFENEIPRAQYGRYEKGHDLRFSSLIKILKAMDISLKDFFNDGFDEK
ncbi:helix-turn-helix domain-containing protein [Aquipluma nitroreducens]|uniref:helix-turn-helix domain-containing protein n=1 Tax=Aquipluma nitroreducens TaxID=2010828 RepID=UPI00296FA3AE|nr:helix-turn-helix transcriptional regulator [Aquipluma nitroreducens]